MFKKTDAWTSPDLRRRAEALERVKLKPEAEPESRLSPSAVSLMLDELRVHQIELELQNEELKISQAELAAAHALHSDFYNLAPVGFLAITPKGLIVQANLTMSALLEVERSELVGQRLTRFILPEDQDIYYFHRKQLPVNGVASACELRLVKKSGGPFWVRIESTLMPDAKQGSLCRSVISDITDRKQAEEELRRSEQEFRYITDTSSDAIWHLDHNLCFDFVSQADERMRGYSPAEVLGKSIIGFFKPEGVERVKQLNAQRLADERRGIRTGKLSCEVEMLCKDGRWLWVEINSTAHHDPAGKLIGYHGVTRDISERVQAESVKRHHAKIQGVLRDVVEAALLAPSMDALYRSVSGLLGSLSIAEKFTIALLDEQQNEIFYPYRETGNVNLPVRRPVGKGLTEYIMKQGQAEFLPAARLRQLKEMGDDQISFEKIRGWLGAPLIDASGKAFGAMAFFSAEEIDLSHSLPLEIFSIIAAQVSMAIERKRAEELLRQSELKYRSVVEKANEGIVIEQDGVLVFVNQRMAEVLGVPHDGLVGRCAADFIWPDDREVVTASFKKLETGEITNNDFDFRAIGAGGQPVWLFLSSAVIQWEGKPATLNMLTDISQRKWAEEKLQASQAALVQDIELAERVQRELLPDLPESPFARIRTLYYPAHFVSGDFYHLEWCNEGHLLRGFLIDVSGHGLATALQTASINVLLRDESLARLPLLGQMRRVNARAEKYFTDGAYAAVIGFELDFSQRQLRYVGAGITQFYVNGRKMETPGMFVGLWNNAEFTTGTLPFAEGDSIYFLTDGFTDALIRQEVAGFGSAGGRSFDEDVATLEKMAGSGRLRDDATGVCIKISQFLSIRPDNVIMKTEN